MRRPGHHRSQPASEARATPRVAPQPPSVPLPEEGSGIEPVAIPSGILFVPGASASIDPRPARDEPATPRSSD